MRQLFAERKVKFIRHVTNIADAAVSTDESAKLRAMQDAKAEYDFLSVEREFCELYNNFAKAVYDARPYDQQPKSHADLVYQGQGKSLRKAKDNLVAYLQKPTKPDSPLYDVAQPVP
jgi:translation elongation factor EF-Ts